MKLVKPAYKLGTKGPGLLDEFLPEVSLRHMHVLLRAVLLSKNDTRQTIGTPQFAARCC